MSTKKLVNLSLAVGIVAGLFVWWPLILPTTKYVLDLGHLGHLKSFASVQLNLANYGKVLHTLQDMSDDDLNLVATDPQPCSKLIDCGLMFNSQVKVLARDEREARAKAKAQKFNDKDQQIRERQYTVAWWTVFFAGAVACLTALTLFFGIYKFYLERKKKTEASSESTPPEGPHWG